MSNSDLTVRQVFDLPQPGSPEESSPRWQTLRQWMSEEVKGIKTAAMPDIGAKIAELLEVPIPDILLASWKKTDAIRELLEESRKTPDAVMNLVLSEHTINSQHRPHIEIRIKKLEFTLKLLFKLKGCILRIQNGAIRDMVAGTCEMKGTLDYQGLTIAEKKLAPINLPGRIALESSLQIDKEKPPPQMALEALPPERIVEPATPLEPPKISAPILERPIISHVDEPKLVPPVKLNANKNEPVRERIPPEIPPAVQEEEEREEFVL